MEVRSTMQAKVNMQKDLFERIYRAHEHFQDCPKERKTEQYIGIRLTMLDQLWSEFTNVHEAIIRGYNWERVQGSWYVREDLYDKTEEFYIAFKCELEQAMKTFAKHSSPTNDSQDTSSTTRTSVRLPEITIPSFSGLYSEWMTFRDLFISLIHCNDALDDVQKLHYLKGHLTGEAEQLLRQIPISAANYQRCWEQLEARYNNKRYLANCILKRLLAQRNSSVESSSALRDLLDTTSDCLHALDNLGIDVKTWDTIVIHIVSGKLDPETRKQWELSVASESSNELPNFTQFRLFLESRFRALEFVEPMNRPSTPTDIQAVTHKVFHVVKAVCAYCSGEHKLYSCRTFNKLDCNKRRKFVGRKRLCFNCLGDIHWARVCPNKSTCRVCGRKHHSVLHPTGLSRGDSNHAGVIRTEKGNVISASERSVASRSVNAMPVFTCFGHLPAREEVVLATAIVKIDSPTGESHVRALLDQASQASFVTEAAVRRLGVVKSPTEAIIAGLEGKEFTSNSIVELNIRSRIKNTTKLTVRAYVLPSISSYLPKVKVEGLNWLDPSTILADPEYNVPNKVDILLGAEVYAQILQEGIQKGPNGYPLAQETSLGWIISGCLQKTTVPSEKVTATHPSTTSDEPMKGINKVESNSYTETTRRDSAVENTERLTFRGHAQDQRNGGFASVKGSGSLQLGYATAVEGPEIDKRKYRKKDDQTGDLVRGYRPVKRKKVIGYQCT